MGYLVLAGAVLYLLVRNEMLKADLAVEKEIYEEDVKFYSDAYEELKRSTGRRGVTA